MRKIKINITNDDRKKLKSIVSKGKCAARTIKRAQVLLKLDTKSKVRRSNDELASMLDISKSTINNIIKDFLDRGFDCIYRKKRSTPPVQSKITGEVEAHIKALACQNPPEGYCKWTLRLLSERMVQMKYIDSISHTSIGNALKKNSLKPHLVQE